MSDDDDILTKANFRQDEYQRLTNYTSCKTSAGQCKESIKCCIPCRKQKKSKLKMPVDEAGWFSFISFSWMTKLMWRAYKKGIAEDDLPLCSRYDMCHYNTKRLEALWNDDVRAHGIEEASLQRVALKFIRARMIMTIILLICTLVLGIIGPTIFLRYFIDWLSTDEPITNGLIWALGLVASEFFRMILYSLVFAINYRTAIRLKSACLGLVYRKMMRLSSVGNKSIGQIINLFANDSQRIYDFIVVGPMIIGAPTVVIAGIIHILLTLGPWALFGMLTFLFFYPLEFGISRLLSYLRRETVKVTDERVRLMNELLASVKLIKMYAWEKKFANSIHEIRQQERRFLEKLAYVQSVSVSLTPTVPVIAAIVTFMSHIGAGFNLTAAQSYSCIGLMVRVRGMLHYLPLSVLAIIEFMNSSKRLQDVLLIQEIKPYIEDCKIEDTAITLEHVSLAWDGDSTCKEADTDDQIRNIEDAELHQKSILSDLCFSIKKGMLVGVCGSVGAGKSSLMYGLLGQMRLKSGKIQVNGSVGYVSQQAWILHTTFKNNILLGEKFDSERYSRVIHACCLEDDVRELPAGHDTEIGERGINLSGGQKQRVSLARALYADKDVYLLDDPLSAVDAFVGQHIFKWVIKDFLKHKTTIFISHLLQYLPQCNQVILLKDGKIAETGTHAELMNKQEGYAHLYEAHMKSEVKNMHADESSTVPLKNNKTLASVSENKNNMTTSKKMPATKPMKAQDKLMTKEKREEGSIPTSTYHSYIQYVGGYIWISFVIIIFMINVASTAFSSWWLSLWLNAGSGNVTVTIGNDTVISDNIADNPDLWFYQSVYGLTILIIIGSSLIRGFTFMKTTLKGSSKMHNLVFLKVFRRPMSFFDTTPSGRIINIFSRDMDEVDVRLPTTVETFLQNIGHILVSLLFVCLIFPYFLFFLGILLVLFFMIRQVSRIGIRDLKRIENVSRSPLYSHINTTIHGLASITAFNKQQMFIDRFQYLFDEKNCAFYLYNCATRWLGIQLDGLALLVITCTAMLSIMLRSYVGVPFAGLALVYAAQLSGIFQYTVRLSTTVEAMFTSVQRIDDYIKSGVTEAPEIIPSNRPDLDWPNQGIISFQDVEMRYRSESPLVLRRISFEIGPEEKIGVVGRTGSGKSSLSVVLFRLVELCGGRITIDGVDIATLGLQDLRSKLSIIPQDPVLFKGTIRHNLDPFEQHTDNDLWSALEQTYLKDTVSALTDRLSGKVEENGNNFSVGERQLICMARALLRNSKILFLDEATAAIDSEIDSKIQKTIKSAFKNCTIITVAHRLNTVMSCSRILVMEEGTALEYDTPTNLLKINSRFSMMVSEAESSVG